MTPLHKAALHALRALESAAELLDERSDAASARNELRRALAAQPDTDPRWAGIDFDLVSAELRDYRSQIERLRAHIDSMAPIAANADGYMETKNPPAVEAAIAAEHAAELAKAKGVRYTNRHYPEKTAYGFTQDGLKELMATIFAGATLCKSLQQPLTDAQLQTVWSSVFDDTSTQPAYMVFARAIEKAHGIGAQE